MGGCILNVDCYMYAIDIKDDITDDTDIFGISYK